MSSRQATGWESVQIAAAASSRVSPPLSGPRASISAAACRWLSNRRRSLAHSNAATPIRVEAQALDEVVDLWDAAFPAGSVAA